MDICKALAVGLPAIAGPTDDRPQYGDGIMKALIAAFALVTLIAGPTFAQSAYTGEQQPVYNASPASPDFGDNGN